MYRPLICLLCLLMPVLAWPVPDDSLDAASLVRVPLGSEYTLEWQDNDTGVTRIALLPAARSPLPERLQVRVLDVSRQHEGHDPAWTEGFHAEYSAASRDSGPALVVRLGPAASGRAPPTPGDYLATLQLASDTTFPAHASQTLSLTLHLPAPQVHALGRVAARQTRGVPGLGWLGAAFGDAGEPGRLVLREDSGKAAAVPLQILEQHDPPLHGEPDTGGVRIEPPGPLRLAAGSELHLLVLPLGKFDLGVSSGHLDVRWPGLAGAVSVPYEVLARRTPMWIFLIAGLGALCGLLSRGWMARRQQVLARRSAALDLQDRLLAQYDRIPSSGFRAQLAEAWRALDAVLNAQPPGNLEQACRDGEAALDGALAGLRRQLEEQGVRQHALQVGLDRPWILPPQCSAALAPMLEKLRAAGDRLREQDADAATELLERLERSDIDAMGGALRRYRIELQAWIRATLAAPPPLEAQALEGLRSLQRAGTPLGDWVPQLQVSVTSEELQRASTDFQRCGRWAQRVSQDAREHALRLLEDLPGVRPGHQRALDAALAASEQSVRRLGREIEDPGQASAQAGHGNEPVSAAWLALFRELSPQLNESALRDQMRRGAWSEAARQVRQALTPPAGAPAVRLEGGTEFSDLFVPPPPAALATPPAAERVTPGSPAQDLTLPLPAAAAVSPLPFDPAGALLAVRRQRSRARAWSTGLQVLQSAVIFALFSAGAYAALEESWTGTFREAAGLFVLAFGIDLSGDGLLETMKKLRLAEA